VQNNRVGVGPIGLGKAQAVAEVTVSVRVISTETAQIFLADQVNNKEKHSLGAGRQSQGQRWGWRHDRGSSAAMAANAALQGAADDIGGKIISRASALPARKGVHHHHDCEARDAALVFGQRFIGREQSSARPTAGFLTAPGG